MAPKAFISWSSGKDAAFALIEARRLGLVDVVGVLTALTSEFDRVAMHGVRHSLLDRQIAALGLPAIKVMIPSPCPNEIYEARMGEACATIRSQGVDHIVFGDLFLEDIRAYREEKLGAIGMTPIFPLWKRETRCLAQDMLGVGMEAHLVCVDPRRLNKSFSGRKFNDALLRDLPPDVDPCGENGEFHTAVSAGPMFSAPIAVSVGRTVNRDGFVFTDLIPDS